MITVWKVSTVTSNNYSIDVTNNNYISFEVEENNLNVAITNNNITISGWVNSNSFGIGQGIYL